MEKLPLTQVTPSYSHSSCGSNRAHDQGYLYDDYAREIPQVNAIAARHCAIQHKKQKTHPSRRHSPLFIVPLLALIVFLVQLGASIADVPSTRLLEGLICNDYYKNASGSLLPEAHCSVSEVQDKLNVIITGLLTLGYLPGILVAIPYGLLADKYGRKSILGLCVLGMVLSQLIWMVVAWNWRRWDLRLVWTSSAALLLGGGESVAEAMVFAMVSDVATEERRAIYFQLEICAVLLAETIAPFTASKLMDHSVWLPIIISPAVMAIGGLLIIAIPETLEIRSYLENSHSQSPWNSPSLSKRARRHVQTFDLSTPWSRFRDSIHATFRLLRTRDVKLLIPTASLTIPVATVTMSIILRYMPVRFGWTLMRTGLVLGIRTGFNILVLLIFLPAMQYILTKYNNVHSDLALARGSMVLLVLGQAVFAAAPNIAVALTGLTIFTLGTSAPSLCRALLARLVDSDSIGRMFSIIALCELVGYLACSIGLGALYQVGMKLGLDTQGSPRVDGNGGWLALVFFCAAVMYFWCGGMLWVIDAKGCGRDTDGSDSIRSRRSGISVKSAQELRVLADGRITRKSPSLDSVSVRV